MTNSSTPRETNHSSLPVKRAVQAMSGYNLVQPNCQIKLNQNECPFDVPQDLKREIMNEALDNNWGRYPGFQPIETKKAIAKSNGLDPDNILIGNGSNELIQAIFQTTISEKNRVVLQSPTFSLYDLMGKVAGAELKTIPLRADLSFDIDALVEESAHPDVRLIVICSPNNPTGSLITLEDTSEIAKVTRGLVVIDEAYHEFSGISYIKLLEEYPNIIITRTFSKAIGAAGLRIGYLIGNPTIVREIEKVKLPYNVNIISLIAAKKLILQKLLIEERTGLIKNERERVFKNLQTIPSVFPYRSHANFILFEVDRRVSDIFYGLIEHGILIRDVSHYPMLERALRVTVGLPDENNAFLNALRTVLNS